MSMSTSIFVATKAAKRSEATKAKGAKVARRAKATALLQTDYVSSYSMSHSLSYSMSMGNGTVYVYN
jgi:hypothetical protein